MAGRPKVLYIAAWGRSGTTIVDNILNGYEGVFSAGELRLLWQRGIIERRDCGCRTPLPECTLWAEVLRRAYRGTTLEPQGVTSLQRQAARIRHTPALLRRPWSDHARRYADHLGRLYRAIHEVTGAALIVDSTKTPAEAALVAGLAGVDAYLLHMVRDPRAVAHSWSRPTRHLDRDELMMGHSPLGSTTSWLAWNALIERVAGAYAGRRLRLRYEDFAADPQERVETVIRFTRTRVGAGPFITPRLVRLDPNHTVAGNPRRFLTGDIHIRLDDAWLRDPRAGIRHGVAALGLPYLLRYGYPLVPRSADLDTTVEAVTVP